MKMYFILRVLLALHITGIVIMAGTTMIDYLTFKTFWKFADQGDNRSLSLIPLMAKYGAFIRTGAGTMLLTGITMLILERSVWWDTGFKIKMVLVVLLVLNGLLVGNKQGHQLRDAVTLHSADFIQYTVSIRESMSRFYPLQLTLFFLIILISVIRFDKVV